MKNQGQLPRYGEQVIVRCKNFQCLGQYDSDHKWRSVFSQEILSDVEGWSRPNDPNIILVPQMPEAESGPPASTSVLLHDRTPSIRRTIKINLLAEAQEAEEWRLRNPVKRAAWIAGFFVCVVLIWMLKLGLDIYFSQWSYTRIVKRSAEIAAQYVEATNNLIKIAEMDRKVAALDRLTTNRFLWAPLLNAMQQPMVDGIQLIRLSGAQKYAKENARTIGSGASKGVIAGGVLERTSLYIVAQDKSPNEQNYLKYKESLSSCDYFVKNLKSSKGFVLEGLLKPPDLNKSDPLSQFTTFVLIANFPEVRHGE
jgi:hypothetical protein